MATYADIIAGARVLLQDSVVPYRYADATLLAFANAAHAAIGGLREDLYHRVEHYTCNADDVYQRLDPAQSLGIVDVLANVADGSPVTSTNRAYLDLFFPGWTAEAAGPTKQWMPTPDNRLVFMVYPRAAAGAQLEVLHAALPLIGATGDTFPLAPVFATATEHFIAGKALSIDDENQNIDKATFHLTRFAEIVVGKVDAPGGDQ